MGPWVKGHFHTEQQKKYAETLFRTILVIFTCKLELAGCGIRNVLFRFSIE